VQACNYRFILVEVERAGVNKLVMEGTAVVLMQQLLLTYTNQILTYTNPKYGHDSLVKIREGCFLRHPGKEGLELKPEVAFRLLPVRITKKMLLSRREIIRCKARNRRLLYIARLTFERI
jgi:hypothetical protein